MSDEYELRDISVNSAGDILAISESDGRSALAAFQRGSVLVTDIQVGYLGTLNGERTYGLLVDDLPLAIPENLFVALRDAISEIIEAERGSTEA